MTNLPFTLLLILHFAGWAILLGGFVASWRTHHHHYGTMLTGAATAMLSGLALLGVSEAGITVGMISKIVLTAVITALAFYGFQKAKAARVGADRAFGGVALANSGEGAAVAVAPALKYLIGALTVVTLVLSVFMR